MKDIPNYEGLYSIDENGNIFSYRTQKFLKPRVHQGYLQLCLTDIDGNYKTCTIHRLVALTYISNPNNLPVVDHIDRNKLNNSVENLRWVSVKENGLNRDWEHSREKIQKACQASAQVNSKAIEMRDKNNHDIIISTYSSAHQAAIQEFGDATKRSSISKCANGKLKSAYGYFWTFAPTNTDTSCEEET